ncbi:MAG: alpha/beta fold hydrolase [Caldilinea sp.]
MITGDDDRIVPTAQSERLAQELPNARLTVIPACGHIAHEECPAPTLEAINQFLASLDN